MANVEILATIFYLGLSFLGYCLLAGGKVTKLERKIQGILFPTVELEYSDYCKKGGLDPKNGKEWAKWVNKKCDVLAIWSHIWYDGDIFVTNDKDFLEENKKSRLIALGARKILTPAEATDFCACMHNGLPVS